MRRYQWHLRWWPDNLWSALRAGAFSLQGRNCQNRSDRLQQGLAVALLDTTGGAELQHSGGGPLVLAHSRINNEGCSGTVMVEYLKQIRVVFGSQIHINNHQVQAG